MDREPTQGPGTSEMSPVDRRAHRVLAPLANRFGLSTRQAGALKMAIGVPIAVGWFALQQFLESTNEWLKFLVPGFPGVLALMGLVEFTSGIPISQLSQSWDSLRGWQRLVLGLLIAAMFTVLILLVLYTWAKLSA